MTSVRNLFVAAALVASGSVFAADTPGLYLVAAGGTSKYDTDCAGTTKCDNSGSAVKVAGGYRFGNSIAAEVISYNFGKAEYAGGGINLELKATAVGAGVAVYSEFSPNWMFTARLGAASVKMKGTVPNVGSTSDTSTQAYAGLGIAYHFTPTVFAEAAYDTTRGKVAGTSGTLSAFTLGLGVKF